jgi:hypothetical protein
VHHIEVDRYVRYNKDVWRVECARCGIAVDDLGMHEAAQVARVLARRMCGAAVAGAHGDEFNQGGLRHMPLSDQAIVAMWAERRPLDERSEVLPGRSTADPVLPV